MEGIRRQLKKARNVESMEQVGAGSREMGRQRTVEQVTETGGRWAKG